ncbi:hypothetical protein TNCV_615381 [Trichonephila clavipes]|nr:hypothetical protein TNCV_615381 [Trichonephila clavipes]
MDWKTAENCLGLARSAGLTRVQRHVRTERNVIPPTSKSIHQWERALKETGTLAVILAPVEDGVEMSWKSDGGADAGKTIGSARALILVKLLELERLL